jgi:uncharacterized membrane protein
VKLAAAAALMVMVMMAGCATAAEEVPVRGGGHCDAARAQRLIGRARSEGVGAEALRLTGARTVRWIPKGAMVTMDYREDRVNLHLDGDGKVVKVACG